jgi:hypothetical protein
VPVALDVAEDDQERLEELAGGSWCRLCCLSLCGQGRADVLERAPEQVVLVAVVGVEGRPSDVGPVQEVLDRDAVIALVLDEREQGAPQQLTGSPYPPIGRGRAQGVPPVPGQLARLRSFVNEPVAIGC